MYSSTPSAHRSIGRPGPEAGACGWSYSSGGQYDLVPTDLVARFGSWLGLGSGSGSGFGFGLANPDPNPNPNPNPNRALELAAVGRDELA